MWPDRATWTYLAILVMAALLWAGSTAEPNLCHFLLPGGVGVGRGVGECIEFWLERYQTLLGAAAAIGAALIAAAPVKRQLKEMSRQSATSARLALVDTARALEEEYDRLGRDSHSRRTWVIEAFEEATHRPGAEVQWLNSLANVINDGVSLRDYLDRMERRYPEPGRLPQARTDANAALGRLSAALYELDNAFRNATGVVDPEEELSSEGIQSALTEAGAAAALWLIRRNRLNSALLDETALVWSRIRELERYALAPT
jgi:hypothetical protein